MATVDQTKDDLATQEMLAMLDAAELEMEAETTQAIPESDAQPSEEAAISNEDMDALLDSLATDDSLESEMVTETSEAAESLNDIDDLDELDEMLAEVTEPETPQPTNEPAEAQAPKPVSGLDSGLDSDLDSGSDIDADLAPNVDSMPDTILDEHAEDDTAITENLSEDDPINAAASIEESLTELENNQTAAAGATEPESTMASKEPTDKPPASSETIELEEAIEMMKQALQMNEQMQQLAAQADETAQGATKAALITAQKAQQMALETQLKIEAQFANAQAAFAEVAQADIQISADQLDALNSAPQMDELYHEIQQKNQLLADANKHIASRLATLQKS